MSAQFDTKQMREDFQDLFREFRNNKDQVKELNRRNSEITKYLDENYQLEKGTAKAYFAKKMKEEEDKDRTEDVLELESLLRD